MEWGLQKKKCEFTGDHLESIQPGDEDMLYCKRPGIAKDSKQDVSTVNSLDYQRWNTTLTG